MSPFDPTADPMDGPWDEIDTAIMADIRRYWETVDPVPDDLVEQACFAVQLSAIGAEMLRLAATEPLVGVRSERTRLITFAGDTLTITINVSGNDDRSARLDGWLYPPMTCGIELRTNTGTQRTESDTEGRFALAAVPSGVAQIVARPTGTDRTVTTPAFSI